MRSKLSFVVFACAVAAWIVAVVGAAIALLAWIQAHVSAWEWRGGWALAPFLIVAVLIYGCLCDASEGCQ